jgi:hypothetical protein
MENIKSLLTNTLDPQARLMQETRGLVTKWDKTGLLDGIKSDIEKSNMAVLLENQAKQLITEATATGTSANSEQWAGVALPLVRRVFAEFAAKEFVSVQPMNLPSGLVFYLDFKYGSARGGNPADTSGSYYQSLFGGTGTKLGSTDQAVGGLYGAGRFGYTINQKTASVNFSVTATTLEDVNWLANYYTQYGASGSVQGASPSITSSLANGQLFTIKSTNFYNQTVASGNPFDPSAVRSFMPYNLVTSSAASAAAITASFVTASNAGTDIYFPPFTKFVVGSGIDAGGAPTGEIQFVISASAPMSGTITLGGITGSVYYSVQPSPQDRGDFEDNVQNSGASTGDQGFPYPTGKSTSDTGLNKDIGIPEVNLQLNSEPIVAKTRKLKAVWTPELAQDLNAYHSIDAEAELTALLSEYVSMEIDLEILDMLITNAPSINTERWSAALNTEIVPNGTGGYVATLTTTGGTGGYYTKATWYQTLGNKIQKVSNRIHQLTLRGGANFMVISPSVATILESIPGFVVNTDGDQAKFAMGVSRVGSFASRFQVYKNPYMTDNIILMGFRGNNFLETGAVYAPYIPLVQTPLVYDPVNFTPRRGVMTRYAKKIVRPEFYGKVLIADLDKV